MVETSSPTSYPGTSDPTSPGPPDLGCTPKWTPFGVVRKECVEGYKGSLGDIPCYG